MNVKMCKGLCKGIVRGVVLTMALLLSGGNVYASDTENVSINVRMKEPTVLSLGTEYNASSLLDMVDVEVTVNGEKDPRASYYVMPQTQFEEMDEVTEEKVRENSVFTTTDELDGDYEILDLTFITFHTFEREVEAEDEASKEESSEDEAEPEVIRETKMATKTIPFLITKTAEDVVEYFKEDTWYECHEGDVTWKYTLTPTGLINRLYTENSNLQAYIIDGTFYVPTKVDDLPVVGIGDGNRTFIPAKAEFDSIVFPATLQVIQDKAFYGNKNYFEAQLPLALTKVGEKAFFSSNITALTVNSSFAELGDMAFANCRYLDYANICGQSVIGRRCFDGGLAGSNLDVVYLYEEAQIGELAFSNNRLLKNLYVTEGTSFSDNCFKGSENITDVYMCGNTKLPKEIFGNAKITNIDRKDSIPNEEETQ
ncbi:MAG: leucine-rich repeat domain-containing protein [Butyrivibrio sp.]|nr:leucine-rich repeat domain-containing protein [Butyrivibrio sp.]